MQIEFRTSEEDYYKFIRAYWFKRYLFRRLLLLIIISVALGSSRRRGHPFDLSEFTLWASAAALAMIVLFAVMPYIVSKIKLKKSLKRNPVTKPKTIFTGDEGITISDENENVFWKWETLSNAEIIDRYLFITLFTNKLYLIPLKSFRSINDSINFLGVIKNGIEKVKPNNNNRRIRNLYYWGLIGFIPNFGVIAGIALIIKGVQYNKTKLMLVGIADILFTVLFWTILLPFLNPNGFNDVSEMQLNDLVKNIEFYKLQHGQYPDSLQQLLQNDKLAPINDPVQMQHHRQKRYFNYEKTEKNYFLFSSGPDGIPGTKDDLFPSITITDNSKVGWIQSRHR